MVQNMSKGWESQGIIEVVDARRVPSTRFLKAARVKVDVSSVMACEKATD